MRLIISFKSFNNGYNINLARSLNFKGFFDFLLLLWCLAKASASGKYRPY